MVRAMRYFLEFCYLVRRSVISEDDLRQIRDALQNFHHFRQIFISTGVRQTISLPRQHAMVHYHDRIRLFGSPNGLCSSITESKHIKAVKEPYYRSNHLNPMGQMILTNQRLASLAAARCEFARRGMLGIVSGSALLRSGSLQVHELFSEEATATGSLQNGMINKSVSSHCHLSNQLITFCIMMILTGDVNTSGTSDSEPEFQSPSLRIDDEDEDKDRHFCVDENNEAGAIPPDGLRPSLGDVKLPTHHSELPW